MKHHHQNSVLQDEQMVKEWEKRTARKEKDERAKQESADAWTAYMVSKKQEEIDERCRKRAKMKEEAEAARGDAKDEDPDYHPSEDAGDRSSLHPSFKPSKKDLKDADKEGDQ